MSLIPAATMAMLAALNGLSRDTAITLRRGEAELPPQIVRLGVYRSLSASTTRGLSGAEQRDSVFLHGPMAMDIAVDDRFTFDGTLFRVRFVRPDRRVATVADLEMVQ